MIVKVLQVIEEALKGKQNAFLLILVIKLGNVVAEKLYMKQGLKDTVHVASNA